MIKQQNKKPPKRATKSIPHIEHLFVYTDGASRGNPGPAGAGIYITDEQNNPLCSRGYFLGNRTNNQAEYLALAIGIFIVSYLLENNHYRTKMITFVADSELLIQQMSGNYRVKNITLLQIKSAIEIMLRTLPHNFKHVKREHNSHADDLANTGLDKKIPLPEAFLKYAYDCQIPL